MSQSQSQSQGQSHTPVIVQGRAHAAVAAAGIAAIAVTWMTGLIAGSYFLLATIFLVIAHLVAWQVRPDKRRPAEWSVTIASASLLPVLAVLGFETWLGVPVIASGLAVCWTAVLVAQATACHRAEHRQC